MTDKPTEATQTQQPTHSPRAQAAFESRGFAHPDHEVSVAAIKKTAAELWTLIDKIPVPPGNTEAGRLVSLAKTDIESSVMWAVKAYSRNTPSPSL